MELILHILQPQSRTVRLQIDGSTMIGRAAECQIRFALPEVSRRHCLLTWNDNQMLVRDLGSSNGTRLNGKPLRPGVDHVLEHGVTIELGSLVCRIDFRLPDTDDPGTVTAGQEDTRHSEWLSTGSCLDEETAVKRTGADGGDLGMAQDSGESSMELPAIEAPAEDFGGPPLPKAPASTADVEDPALQDFLRKISD
jgi:predicted component of type VI protein secretion system